MSVCRSVGLSVCLWTTSFIASFWPCKCIIVVFVVVSNHVTVVNIFFCCECTSISGNVNQSECQFGILVVSLSVLMGFIDVLCCIFCIDLDVALINEREIAFISLTYGATLVENEKNTITITWIHL